MCEKIRRPPKTVSLHSLFFFFHSDASNSRNAFDTQGKFDTVDGALIGPTDENGSILFLEGG